MAVGVEKQLWEKHSGHFVYFCKILPNHSSRPDSAAPDVEEGNFPTLRPGGPTLLNNNIKHSLSRRLKCLIENSDLQKAVIGGDYPPASRLTMVSVNCRIPVATGYVFTTLLVSPWRD